MAVGIYFSGLNHTTDNETVEKYAARYVKELEKATLDFCYYTKIEKINYFKNNSSLVISIFEHPKNSSKSNSDKLVYKLYDFEYQEQLHSDFLSKNIIFKNISLFVWVLKRFPRILLNLFKKVTYQKGGKTIAMFFLFFLMSLGVIVLLPFLVISFETRFILENQSIIPSLNTLNLLLKYVILLTVTFILCIPESNIILTKIAAEFITLDYYIQNTTDKQVIKHTLQALLQYIDKEEPNKKIHFHTYSFGSIIALDTLFPMKFEPSVTIQNKINVLITIGAPFEFINQYYPNFYKNRIDTMTKKIQWINVYSLVDAYASNFRYDNKVGEANFGILNKQEIPININFEISEKNNANGLDFFGLKQIFMHKSYWDDTNSGTSCTQLIYFKMKEIGQWSTV